MIMWLRKVKAQTVMIKEIDTWKKDNFGIDRRLLASQYDFLSTEVINYKRWAKSVKDWNCNPHPNYLYYFEFDWFWNYRHN